MIKSDFGHLNCPYYTTKIKDDVDVFYIPRNSKIKTATVYISKGGLKSTSKEDKTVSGTAYLTMKYLSSNEKKADLSKEGISLSTRFDHSFTCFDLESISGDIFKALDMILSDISLPNISEEKLNTVRIQAKEDLKAIYEDGIYQSQTGVLDNLYFKSPIKEGLYPSLEDLDRIHASTIKKFMDKYYKRDRITIFLSGDISADDLRTSLPLLHLPKSALYKDVISAIDEDYQRVNRDEKIVKADVKNNVMTYGIKFPSREMIYNSYSDDMFYIYELLTDVLFVKKDTFKDGLYKMNCSLIECKLLQAGEDTSLLISLNCQDESLASSFVTGYIDKLSKRVSKDLFKKVRDEYFAGCNRSLSSPKETITSFTSVHPNHITYTALVSKTMHLSYKTFIKFLDDLKTFKKSYYFITRG